MNPFEPEVEAALLVVLRKTKVWPCFMESKRKIGKYGTRIRGYWESKTSCAARENPPQSSHAGPSIGQSRQLTRSECDYLLHMWLRFQKAAGYAHPEKSVPPLWFLKYYRETGLIALECINMIKWKLPYSDSPIFFSRNFILPTTSQRQFSKEKPIGTFMGDKMTLSVVDEDDIARKIHHGSMNGKSILNFRVNLIQASHSLRSSRVKR